MFVFTYLWFHDLVRLDNVQGSLGSRQWRSRGYCRPGPNIYGRPYWCSRNTYASAIAAPVKVPAAAPYAPPILYFIFYSTQFYQHYSESWIHAIIIIIYMYIYIVVSCNKGRGMCYPFCSSSSSSRRTSNSSLVVVIVNSGIVVVVVEIVIAVVELVIIVLVIIVMSQHGFSTKKWKPLMMMIVTNKYNKTDKKRILYKNIFYCL